jgi:hypothetical protein
MTKKLYSVETVRPVFEGHCNVTIDWFVGRRTIPVQRPYAELIAGYDRAENVAYAKAAIDELFSADEAEAFVGWLKDNRVATDADTTLDEVALPIANNTIGLEVLPAGRILHMDEIADDPAASPLGFTVLGYYDLRAYEPIEIMADDEVGRDDGDIDLA